MSVLKVRYNGRLVSVVLFGSAARGTQRLDSDLDLLVVLRRLPKSRLDRHGLMEAAARQVSEAFARQVSIVPLTPEEAATVKPFYLGMLSGHHILYDRDDFFQEILRRLRRRLAELGSERRLNAEGLEYWILKKDVRLGEAIVL